jgi:hypothetical protein
MNGVLLEAHARNEFGQGAAGTHKLGDVVGACDATSAWPKGFEANRSIPRA